MKKYNTTFILVGVMLLVLTISTAVYASDASVSENNVNVRSGPGLDYDVIGQVNKNESYPILNENEEWAEINLGQMSGWITKQYITIENSDLTTDETPTTSDTPKNADTQKITVKFDQTNIRNGPSTAYDIIEYANQRDVFQVVSMENEWYEIQLEDNTGYIPTWVVEPEAITNHATTEGLKNKTIVIDAGHGGIDVGAIGSSGRYEKEYTLLTADILKAHLEILGSEVILTRGTDHYQSLSGRASLSNALAADAFISLHYNSTPQYPTASGINTYYYSNKDDDLAYTIQNELLKATGMRDRGTKKESYQVLRENHRPAVLVELGFLSNQAEESKIQLGAFQQKLTKGIINGLNDYFLSEN